MNAACSRTAVIASGGKGGAAAGGAAATAAAGRAVTVAGGAVVGGAIAADATAFSEEVGVLDFEGGATAGGSCTPGRAEGARGLLHEGHGRGQRQHAPHLLPREAQPLNLLFIIYYKAGVVVVVVMEVVVIHDHMIIHDYSLIHFSPFIRDS